MNAEKIRRWAMTTVAALLAAGAASAGDGPPQNQRPSDVAAAPVTGYLQLMPRFYVLRGDQGYLQRYRTLRPPNERTLDRVLESAGEFHLNLYPLAGGPPYLELLHGNSSLMDDAWWLRIRPAPGLRLDLRWNDYQRGFEKFRPPTEPETFSYARLFNDSIAAGDYLRRRRSEFQLLFRLDPSARPQAPSLVRELSLEYQRAIRRGYRQFNWIFGQAEDLVVPVGTDPARWRGRTEDVDQAVDRYSTGATFSLRRSSHLSLRFFGEQFANQAAAFTNADVARFDPRVNRQARTINFIADYRVLGGEVILRQEVGPRARITLDGLIEDLKQTSFAPLQGAAGYDAGMRHATAGASLEVDAAETTFVEAFARWRKRTNRTPVGTSVAAPRAYLLADRNLSFPFLRALSDFAFGGSVTQYARDVTIRAGVQHTNASRDFVRPFGTNAIPEGLTVYRPRSQPTEVWASVSGRPAKQLKWSARSELRTALQTSMPMEPSRSFRLRGALTLANTAGKLGATATVSLRDEHNDQFALWSPSGQAPQFWDARNISAGLQAWLLASETTQFHFAFQHLDNTSHTDLVGTDVRRWRPIVLPSTIEQRYGYDNSASVLTGGAAVAVGPRLTVLPSFHLAVSDGGILSTRTPTREFTLLDNRNAGFGAGVDYKVSQRNLLHLRYDYNRYDDDVTASLSGRYHGLSFGFSRVF